MLRRAGRIAMVIRCGCGGSSAARPQRRSPRAVLQPPGLPGARPARAYARAPRYRPSGCWRSSGRSAAEDWLGWQRRGAQPATEEELQLVHSAGLVERIREMCMAGGGAIDPDTFVGEASYRAALHAAGGACEMTSALLAGEAALGFCEVRPSGHHAEPDRAMGFCLFNNVAVAAEFAIRELGAQRVFILDWDVHHGNGTAEAFRHRADVLFVSIHQAGIYPGSGAAERRRLGRGRGLHDQPARAGRLRGGSVAVADRAHRGARLPRPSRPTSCSSLRALTPIAPTRWRAAAWSRTRSPRWPATCATRGGAAACRSAWCSRAAMNRRRSRSP